MIWSWWEMENASGWCRGTDARDLGVFSPVWVVWTMWCKCLALLYFAGL
jgi:hypothetical protein